MITATVELWRESAEHRLRRKHSLPRSDAEEVSQDALIALVKLVEAGKVREADAPAMLITIVDRRAADRARANKRRAKVEKPSGNTDDLSVLGQRFITIEDNLFTADFDAALRALPAEERDAFILYQLRGVSQYEAASLLDIPADTVVSRAERAASMIRKELP